MSWFSDQYEKWILKKAYNWGKSRATHKLKVFKTFQENYPEMSKRELYYNTILISRDFTERRAEQIINMVEGNDNSLFSMPEFMSRPFCLQEVIKSMLSVECLTLFDLKPPPHRDFMYHACKGVEDTIPNDI